MEKTNDLNFVAFDFEATYTKQLGFHEIIEIGAFRFEMKDGNKSDQYHELVKPLGYVSPIIKQKTGINDNMLTNCKSIKEIWPNFISFIADSILLVYNSSFDMNVIDKVSKYYGLQPIGNSFLDVMKLAKRLYPNESSYSLESFQERLFLNRQSHRADADAYVTACLFKQLLKIAESKYHIYDFKALQDFSNNIDNSQQTLF